MRSVPLALDAMIQDHERDWSSDHIEWAYLGEMCTMTDGALALLLRVLTGLKVYPQRMAKNLDLLDGLALSEAIMLALGTELGRQTAHEVVYECAMRSFEQELPFRQVLGAHPLVSAHLTQAQIDDLLDPAHYTGLAGQFVDRVVASAGYSTD
jgi:adenylosuccinate lyase